MHNFIIKLLLGLISIWLVLNILLKLTIGVTFGYINPFNLSINNITFKDILLIKSIQFDLLNKTIILSGTAIKKIPSNNNSRTEKPKENVNENVNDIKEENNFHHFDTFKQAVKIPKFLDNFSVFIKNLSIDKIQTEFIAVRLFLKFNSNDTFNIDINSANILWNNNSIVSDFSINLISTTQYLNNLSINSKFGNVQLPINKFLSDNILKDLPSLKKIETLNKSNAVKTLTEDDIINYIQNFTVKIVKLSSKLRLIDECHIYIDNLSLLNINFTNYKNLSLINKKLNYSISTKNLSLSCSKFIDKLPGFSLIYNKNIDTPYKISSNLSSLVISLNESSNNSILKILEIPNIFFFGHSNIFSSTFCPYKKDSFNKAILTVKGQLTNPVIDLDIQTLSLIKALSDNLNIFKSIFVNDPNKNSKCKNCKLIILSILKCMLPIINLQISVRDPNVIIRNFITTNKNEIEKQFLIFKFKDLIYNIKSEKIFNSENKDQIYLFENSLSLLNLQMTHKVVKPNEKPFSFEFAKISNLSVLQTIQIKPSVLISFKSFLDMVNIDLSDLITGTNLSKMFHSFNDNMKSIEKKYFDDIYDTLIRHLLSEESLQCSINKKSEIKSSISKSRVLLNSLIFNNLPEYFDYFKFLITDITLTLGSRSVFMPTEMFQSVESQSPKDLIDNQLRKFRLKLKSADLSIYNENSTILPSNSNSNFSSSSLDDISSLSSDETKVNYSWLISLSIPTISSSVIYEPESKSNALLYKPISKVQNISLKIFPSINSIDDNTNNDISSNTDNKVVVQLNVDRSDAIFCLMNIFLMISGYHTLNQIFKLPKPPSNTQLSSKDYLKIIKKNLVKEITNDDMGLSILDFDHIKSLISFSASVNLISQILSLPNGCKARVEFINTLVSVEDGLSSFHITGDYFRFLTESAVVDNKWDRMLLICRYLIKLDKTILEQQMKLDIDNSDDFFAKLTNLLPAVILKNETWHFCIPYKFEMYRLFDNITTITKTIKQILYSFKTSNNDLVIFPKKVSKFPVLPKVKLLSNRGIISFADDPFEAKMNTIFQIGLKEQRERLAKIKEFNIAATEIMNQTSNKSGINSTENTKTKKTVDVFEKICVVSKMFKCNQSKYNKSKIANAGDLDGKTANYDDSDVFEFNDTTMLPHAIEKSFNSLLKNISKSWIKRIETHRHEEKKNFLNSFDFLWGNIDKSQIPPDLNKKVVDFTTSPYLSTLIIEDIDITVFRPQCGIDNVPQFIHDVGKGVPLETEYAIMFPMYLDAKFSEIRWHLKDYPLPFVHVPHLLKEQSDFTESIRIHGDFIASEDLFQSEQEVRTIFVPLVPSIIKENMDNYYSLLVPRTLTSIKMFANLNLEIFSNASTVVTWCESYSPAIQQVMQTVEHFTKPPLDPSKKVGFWDRLRYMFHARVKIRWQEEGKFNFCLKGSKSPYEMSQHNAGFVLGFSNNVVLECNSNDDPKNFLICSADTVHFSIPNHFARPLLVWCKSSSDAVFVPTQEDSNLQKSTSFYYFADQVKDKNHEYGVEIMNKAYIEKTCVKLSGSVTLNVGIVFERLLDNKEERTFEFEPHHTIRLCNPIYVKDLKKHDSYRGLRSNFIHMSLSIISNSKEAYNAMQLTPNNVMTFLVWWQTFSGNINARRGKLYGSTSGAPKFGNSLFTLSYRAEVLNLFISNIQTNIDTDRIMSNNFLETSEFAGIKGKVAEFKMDLHQRKEILNVYKKDLDIRKTLLQLKFLEGDFSLYGIDIRAIQAQFKRANFIEEIENAKFDIFDDDLEWYDRSDFNEAFLINIDNCVPHVKIQPLLCAPNFYYQKRATYCDTYQVNPKTFEPITPFRNYVSHDCTLGQQLKPHGCLISNRVSSLEKCEKSLKASLKKTNDPVVKKLIKEVKIARNNVSLLLDDLLTIKKHYDNPSEDYKYNYEIMESVHLVNAATLGFGNRYYLFNMLLTWNTENSVIIQKFVTYFSLRRQFFSLQFRKSLRVFEEMVANLDKEYNEQEGPRINPKISKCDDKFKKCKRKDNETLLDIFKKGMTEILCGCQHALYYDTVIQLIAPQIQLITDESAETCITVTAPLIKFKGISFDGRANKDITDPNVIVKRFGMLFQNANMFVFNKSQYGRYCHIFFESHSYGHSKNKQWPPWLGIEICLDPSALERNAIIQKLSAVFFFDTVPYSKTILDSTRHRLNDSVRGFVPEITIKSDSKSYVSVYKVLSQFILSTESSKEQLNKKIEKLKIAYDTRDLRNMFWTSTQLNHNVRLLNNILSEFLFKQRLLDDAGKVDLVNLHNERMYHLLKLYMLMEVFDSKCKERDDSKHFIVWNIKVKNVNLHLLNNDRTPFINANVQKIALDRTLHASGANHSSITVGDISIEDKEEGIIYPHILKRDEVERLRTKCFRPVSNEALAKLGSSFLKIEWCLGTPVGGIPLINNAETIVTNIIANIDEERITKLLRWVLPEEVTLLKNKKDGSDSDKQILASNSTNSESGESLIGDDIVNSSRYNKELNEMISRSSNYFIVKSMLLNGFDICLSYRGKGTKRLANVTEFIFKFPTKQFDDEVLMILEVLNQFKKSIIKAIVQQSGNLIGAKLRVNPKRRKTVTSMNKPLKLLTSRPSLDLRNNKEKLPKIDTNSETKQKRKSIARTQTS